VDSEVGSGFETVQVDGIGTMAGPPARGVLLLVVAGSAFATANNAPVKSKLMVVESIVFEV
jgi:hypothetical protein